MSDTEIGRRVLNEYYKVPYVSCCDKVCIKDIHKVLQNPGEETNNWERRERDDSNGKGKNDTSTGN